MLIRICGRPELWLLFGLFAGLGFLTIGVPRGRLSTVFGSIETADVARFDHRMPDGDDLPVYVCRDPKMPLQEAWPCSEHYDRPRVSTREPRAGIAGRAVPRRFVIPRSSKPSSLAGVKRSARPACCTGVETEFESANEMRGRDPLSRRLAGGDPGAPGEMVERHRAELYRYARALLRDAPAAEDAVQEAFERAFVALGKYPEERIEALSLRPWLYRIVLNVVRNAWRKGRREAPVAEMPERTDEGFGSASGSAPGGNREAWMDALEALGRLSERQRVAVSLRYLEDLPYAGMAEVTGWPENTCKTLVRRGIRRLGALLSEGSDEKNGGL